MSDRTPVPLTPTRIELGTPEVEAIAGWPYADPFVPRLLRNDIPQRVLFGECRVWVYRDPEGRFVGFGTLDVCDDYGHYTFGRNHPYIPLLAVNPTIKSLGYGTTILGHLTNEAALLVCRPGGCHDVLFLDVYTTSVKAVGLYTSTGFVQITPEPIPDVQESGKLYIVMAKRVTIASALMFRSRPRRGVRPTTPHRSRPARTPAAAARGSRRCTPSSRFGPNAGAGRTAPAP